MNKHIPNTLTSFNLICGCIASVMVFRNHLDTAAYLVFVAAFFDLIDGMAARVLNVHSLMGKELDSLADVISFGFVPGAILFKLLQSSAFEQQFPDENVRRVLQFLPFVVTVFSAIRLAKFNIDTRQSSSFIGLPTPANTLFVVSLPLILINEPGRFDAVILNPYFLFAISFFLSWLLVAEIPLFALKFKNFGWSDNRYQYILLVLALVLFPLFLFAAIPLILLSYVLLSIIQNKLNKKST